LPDKNDLTIAALKEMGKLQLLRLTGKKPYSISNSQSPPMH